MGLDCVGVVACALKDSGIEVDVPVDYSASPYPDLILPYVRRYCAEIRECEVLPGDIIVFKLYTSRPRHLGIITQCNPLYMVHAYSGAERVSEHQLDDRWLQLVHSYWRVNYE